MSFFDDIKAKVEEMLGGAGEDITGSIGDAAGNVTDITDHVQDSILGNGEGGDSEK